MRLPENQKISNRREYGADCPVGTWRARLDGKAWGKQAKFRSARTLNLYFSEIESGKKYVISIYWARYNGYWPVKGGVDFKVEAEPGECFELGTAKATNSMTILVSARKL
jgi:hypothetical protein